MSITNFELQQLAKHYKLPLKLVVMKNELAHYDPQFGDYIVNLQSQSQGSGTHWTALSIRPNGAVFSDSFGAPPSMEVRDFVTPVKCRFAVNCWIYQALESELCGYYCLGMFMWLAQHKNQDIFATFNAFINMFEDDTSKNDDILKEYFRTYPIKPNAFIKRRLFPKKIK